jgi:Flp pilus assembly protein TadG
VVTSRKRGPEDGAAALEMALVAPLFIAIVLGIINIGWAVFCGAEVRHAVERSTRMLIADPSIADDLSAGSATMQEAVRDALSAADPDEVDVTLTKETVGTSGTVARLAWTYGYTIDAPFVDPISIDFDSSLVVPLRA